MKRKDGFTLLEIAIALAILGIGLMVTIELFSGGLRSNRIAGEYTKAAQYARIKMEEIHAKPPIKEMEEEGEFDNTYRWRTEFKKWNVLPEEKEGTITPSVELLQVKVLIFWKSGIKERSIAVETFKTIKPEDAEKKS